MNLADKMTKWGELQSEAEKLKSEIQEEVLSLGKTQTVGNVTASYSKGKGSYNYQQIVMTLEPEQDVIDKHSKVVVDWKSVAEESGITDELKEKFYTPADHPTVSVKLVQENTRNTI